MSINRRIIITQGQHTLSMKTGTRGRTLWHWLARILLGLVIVLALLLVIAAGWQGLASAADRRTYPPPGTLVDVGGYHLHIYCMGEGSPTVILDALGDGTSAHWGWVQPAVAKVTRVCAYDRAGRGWSDVDPTPRDGERMAQALHTLLANAEIDGPKVLVGHSFGGMLALLYADLNPEEVAGMVLVDTGLPGLRSSRMPAAAHEQAAAELDLMNAAPWMARLGIFRLLGSGAMLPEPQRSQVEMFYASNRHWNSLLAVMQILPAIDAQVEVVVNGDDGRWGERPLLILAATRGWVDPNAPADESRQRYNMLQQELLSLAPNRVYREVAGASHASLVLNEADAAAVSAGIVEVVEAVRNGTRLAP